MSYWLHDHPAMDGTVGRLLKSSVRRSFIPGKRLARFREEARARAVATTRSDRVPPCGTTRRVEIVGPATSV